MVPEVALNTKMARGVARKAGLRRGTGVVETTVVSDYIGIAEQPILARQWLVDLTECTRARFYSGSSALVYLLTSESVESEVLDPGNFATFVDVDSVAFSCQAGDAPEWRAIALSQRGPQRLALFISGDPLALDGPFPVLFQAA